MLQSQKVKPGKLKGHKPSRVSFDNLKVWILKRFIVEVVYGCGRNVQLGMLTGLLCSRIENCGVTPPHPPRCCNGDAMALQRDFAGDSLRLNHTLEPSLLNFVPVHLLRCSKTGSAIFAFLSLLLFCTGTNRRNSCSSSRNGSDIAIE
jgi:hypothetical protein